MLGLGVPSAIIGKQLFKQAITGGKHERCLVVCAFLAKAGPLCIVPFSPSRLPRGQDVSSSVGLGSISDGANPFREFCNPLVFQ